MAELCRVCLKTDPDVPFFSLVDGETRNLFEECTHATEDETLTFLCPGCHYQCLEWRKYKKQATKSYERYLSGTDDASCQDRCLVCQEEVNASESHSLTDKDVREKFMECTSIVLFKREDYIAPQLCTECFNICLRWSAFRSLSIESREKQTHLSLDKANNPVETTEPQIKDVKEEPINDEVEEQAIAVEFDGVAVDANGWLEYEIDIVKPELPIKEEIPVESQSSSMRAIESSSKTSREKPASERTISEETEFNCSFCKQTFSTRFTLFLHERTHKVHSCKDCNRSFRNLAALNIHLAAHRRCQFCSEVFLSLPKLNDHMYSMHKEEVQRMAREQGNYGRRKRSSPERIFQRIPPNIRTVLFDTNFTRRRNERQPENFCPKCKKVYANEKSLRRHSMRPVGCRVCRQTFCNSYELREHQRQTCGDAEEQEGESSFVCGRCDSVFTSRVYFNRHNWKHHNIEYRP